MKFEIDQLVADCVAAVREADKHAGAAIQEIIGRAVSDPTAIVAAVGQPSDQPAISTWHNSPELTILHIIWPPEVEVTPHDHLMWASIGLYGGREDNQLFRVLPDGSLEQRKDRTLRAGDTILLGDDTVHAVANPSRAWTGAIHVYGGDFFQSGKRMWPRSDQPAIDYNVETVRATIKAAAAKARGGAPTTGAQEP